VRNVAAHPFDTIRRVIEQTGPLPDAVTQRAAPMRQRGLATVNRTTDDLCGFSREHRQRVE
jgi:hypothetical protein